MSDEDPWTSVRAPVAEVPHLHRPGQAEIVRKVRFPDDVRDRRLHFDLAALRRLVEIAESSPLQRVVLHGVQVEVEVRRDAGGHTWENWAVVARDVVPEGTHRDQTVRAREGAVPSPLGVLR